MSEITLRIEGRYRREQTDAGRLRTALHVEEVAALAYATAAERVLEGEERAVAERFAAHEREHAGALMTMTLALTLEVRRHAVREGRGQPDARLRGAGPAGDARGAARARDRRDRGPAGAGRGTWSTSTRCGRSAMVMAGGAQHLVVLRDLLDEKPLTNVFENG